MSFPFSSCSQRVYYCFVVIIKCKKKRHFLGIWGKKPTLDFIFVFPFFYLWRGVRRFNNTNRRPSVLSQSVSKTICRFLIVSSVMDVVFLFPSPQHHRSMAAKLHTSLHLHILFLLPYSFSILHDITSAGLFFSDLFSKYAFIIDPLFMKQKGILSKFTVDFFRFDIFST